MSHFLLFLFQDLAYMAIFSFISVSLAYGAGALGWCLCRRPRTGRADLPPAPTYLLASVDNLDNDDPEKATVRRSVSQASLQVCGGETRGETLSFKSALI